MFLFLLWYYKYVNDNHCLTRGDYVRKYIIFLILILFTLTVTACSSNTPYSPSTETLDLTLFTLPEGFVLEKQTQTTAVIKYND